MSASRNTKNTGDGSVQCSVCSAVVKSKIWTAHVNGRKHRENAQKLKDADEQRKIVTTLPQHASSGKRKLMNDVTTESTAKRLKEATYDEKSIVHNASYRRETPWQSEARVTGIAAEGKPVMFPRIEGVPTGFFDADHGTEKEKPNRTEKNASKEVDHSTRAPISADSSLWDQHIDKENLVVDDDQGFDDAYLVQKDIESIDQHIEGWKRINRLEKMKEELILKLRNKNTCPASDQALDEVVPQAEEHFGIKEDGEDEKEAIRLGYDIYWRSKTVL